ncbi:MAG: TetR/AcrR family transcriptional regulator [Actinomycetota bacterium]|nr:TetR/AcrR family transcriptional regulator [Actinomycetota bacterium]
MDEVNRALTRASILRASLGVFKDSGYQDASLGEIARRADVPLENLLEIFPDKEELYNQACRSAVESWHNWFVEKSRMESDALASFIALCREAFFFLARHDETRGFLQTGPLVFTFSSERFNDITDRGVAFLAAKLRECAEAGIFRAMDYERVAVTMHEIFKLLILTTYTQPHDKRSEDLFENVLDLFLHGLFEREAPARSPGTEQR